LFAGRVVIPVTVMLQEAEALPILFLGLNEQNKPIMKKLD